MRAFRLAYDGTGYRGFQRLERLEQRVLDGLAVGLALEAAVAGAVIGQPEGAHAVGYGPGRFNPWRRYRDRV